MSALEFVISSNGVPYVERLDARRLLFLAYERLGDIAKYEQALQAYLQEIAKNEGHGAEMDRLAAEASRLRGNREFARSIKCFVILPEMISRKMG